MEVAASSSGAVAAGQAANELAWTFDSSTLAQDGHPVRLTKRGSDGHSAALGGAVLTEGTHMLTFRIDVARGNGGNMVLGVADAEACLPHMAGGATLDAAGERPIAWGFHPFYGRILETRSLCEPGTAVDRPHDRAHDRRGHYGAAEAIRYEARRLAGMPGYEPPRPEGSERDVFSRPRMPARLPSLKGSASGATVRVAIDMGKRTLHFSVGSRAMVDSHIELPRAVRPYVLLYWEGDAVTCLGCSPHRSVAEAAAPPASGKAVVIELEPSDGRTFAYLSLAGAKVLSPME